MSPDRCQPTPVPENPGCSMRTCCRPIYGTASAQLQVQASVFNHVRPVIASSTCEPLVSQVAKYGEGLRSLLQTPTRAVRGLVVASMYLCHTIAVERCLRLCPHRRLLE